MNSQPEHRGESGATAVEYAVLIAMVAAVIFVVIAVLGTKVIPLYELTF
ncbi:MAG: hypothetical protein JWN68_1964 [Nocardioides sp.]|jgi:Flp pilus assembly pilin Flp|nr:Flp family type IVb pilin [Nocardioides sp.]MCW2834011.1 hypothetical protein [Nocardioides sp.]